MSIMVCNIDTLMSDSVRNRHRRISQFNQQTDVAVPKIMNSDPLDASGFRTAIHLMVQIIFCYLKHTLLRSDPVELLQIIPDFII